MGYIDIHSHILPAVDDGAANIDEAIVLLIQEKENGVSSVICTPHFYPEVEELEQHLSKCRNAFESLKEAIKLRDLPDIFLGHEVQYFTGISKCADLDKLCIEGTNILLLELPFLSPLSEYMLKEVESIDRDLGITVILAHIERYANDRLFKKLLKIIANGDAKGQINADSVLNDLSSKTVNKLLKRGYVSFIASDTHSPSSRPVLIKKAYSALKEKYYSQLVAIKKNTDKLEGIIKGE
jgi:protein-tyrosine phosphatase